MKIDQYLKHLVLVGGSDLYISAGAMPMARIEGAVHPIAENPISQDATQSLIDSFLNDTQKQQFATDLELNIAVQLPEIGRFRINIFRQQGGMALVARHVRDEIPSFKALGLPSQLQNFIFEQHGLLLVVGGTGVGKSTTLASLIAHRAKKQRGHILTVEDPIEFVHQHHNSIINQREIGQDTHSWEAALRNGMRETPDVIMIGEIRDMEAMRHALNYAESGHLCVATLHANNARYAMSRIINFFPPEAHNQIFMDLSIHLKAVVAQRLCTGADGKLVAAFEIMTNTPYVSELVRAGQLTKLRDAMERDGQTELQTFDDDLFRLCRKGKITEKEALRQADSKHNLSIRLKNG